MKKLLPFVALVVVVAAYFVLTMDRIAWKTVTSSALNLSFEYPVHSNLAGDPLKGTVSATIAYDHIPSDLKDWTISTEAKNAIIASMSCAPLQGTGAYLPVDREKPMQCGVVKSPSGLVSAYVIGVGRPDSGTYYPASMILTLQETGATLLTKVAKFPVTEKLANEKVESFMKLHPQAVIWPPDANAKQLYIDVDEVVTSAVSTPIPEVTEGLAVLKTIAESVKPLE
jgi:hypothetical protein